MKRFIGLLFLGLSLILIIGCGHEEKESEQILHWMMAGKSVDFTNPSIELYTADPDNRDVVNLTPKKIERLESLLQEPDYIRLKEGYDNIPGAKSVRISDDHQSAIFYSNEMRDPNISSAPFLYIVVKKESTNEYHYYRVMEPLDLVDQMNKILR